MPVYASIEPIYKGGIDKKIAQQPQANIPFRTLFSICETIGENSALRRSGFTAANSRFHRHSNRSRTFRRQTRRRTHNRLPHDAQECQVHRELPVLPPSKNQPKPSGTALKGFVAHFSNQKRPQKNRKHSGTRKNTPRLHPSPKLPTSLHPSSRHNQSHKTPRHHSHLRLLPTPKPRKHTTLSGSRRRQNRHSIRCGNGKT